MYDELYFCNYRGAKGIIGRNNDEWYILKGSCRADEATDSYKNHENKNLPINEDGYFTEDMKVKSKTLAVSILGRHGV